MTASLSLLTVADVPPDPSSGAAGTVFYTNVALRQLGHQVDEVWSNHLPRRRIGHGNLHSLFEQPRSYRRAIVNRVTSERYDVVQISQPQAWLAARWLKESGFTGIIVNRSHGVELRADKVLSLWYGRLRQPESRAPFLTKVIKRRLRKQWDGIRQYCDGVIVGCHMDRDFLLSEAGFDENRVAAIAHGVEPGYSEKAPITRSPERQDRILTVGQHAFFKGAPLTPLIINRVLKAERRASFTWVCSARDHPHIQGSIDGELRSRVELVDWMPIGALREIYDRHDLFLFPSFFEGFGKAALEAMARGLCVVASDEGGMRDCIASGVSGWLCPVGDVEKFTDRLLHAIRTPHQTAVIGNTASAVAAKYSWLRCAAMAIDFYRSIMTARCR